MREKAWELVPERMKSLEMGIALVPPILAKWCMNMMWFVIGDFSSKMVLGSLSAVERHDRVVTPAPKDEKRFGYHFLLRLFE